MMKRLLVIAFLFVPSCSCFAGTSQQVLFVASNLVGVREATGHNDGAMVTRIVNEGGGLDNEAQIRRTGTGYSWCLAFCLFCYRQAYQPPVFPRMARVQTFWEMARDNELRYKTFDPEDGRPQPADIGCFSHHPGRRSWDGHAVLVTASLSASSFSTIEGNTNSAGSREGDGVYRKVRYISRPGMELQGFVRSRGR